MDREYDDELITKEKLSFDGSWHIVTEKSINKIKKIYPNTIFERNENYWRLSDRNFIEHFKNNDIDAVNLLLDYCKYPDPIYLLEMAVAFSNENMINYLLLKEIVYAHQLYNAIVMACTRVDNPSILEILLGQKIYHGAVNIDIKYSDGLFMAQAVVSNNIPGIKILLQHGFDMESHGKKFLYLALRKKAYESFNYLIRDPDSFVYNLLEDYPCLISNFIQYINDYKIELHPDSLQKMTGKN
jgi:hypothetical protein